MDEKYAQHGAFSWFELATTDVAGAKEFYKTVFGWSYEKYDGDPTAEYHMVKVGDEPVAGIMKKPPEMDHNPPGWGMYITVDDVDVTAAKVEEQGGKVIVPPMDIPKIGRFCVFVDPQGAMISAITYLPME